MLAGVLDNVENGALPVANGRVTLVLVCLVL